MPDMLSEVLSFLAGLLSGFSIKVVIDKRRTDKSTTSTTQTGNIVQGDQAGRDIRK